MDNILLQFINTLDLSLKKHQMDQGNIEGFNRLTISQLQYIDAVGGLGNPTISKIAEHLRFSKASVTAGVNKLVNTGYMIKSSSETDKREVHITLTETGKKMVQAKYNTIIKYEELIHSALDDQETVNFQNALIKIINKFNRQ